jgi:hypothetical protein
MFDAQKSLTPPKTLLNLTVNMIDALSVEFALVADNALFQSFKTKWFGESKNSDQCPGESWGGEDHHHAQQGMTASAGGCLVLTMPNISPRDLKQAKSRKDTMLEHVIKIDPNMLQHVDLQVPANFVKMLITA